jgi:hypothetical protein
MGGFDGLMLQLVRGIDRAAWQLVSCLELGFDAIDFGRSGSAK